MISPKDAHRIFKEQKMLEEQTWIQEKPDKQLFDMICEKVELPDVQDQILNKILYEGFNPNQIILARIYAVQGEKKIQFINALNIDKGKIILKPICYCFWSKSKSYKYIIKLEGSSFQGYILKTKTILYINTVNHETHFILTKPKKKGLLSQLLGL